MIDIAVLRTAGLTDAQIVRVIEVEQNEKKLARREQNRISKQKQRARQHLSAFSADRADIADPPKKSPTPPKNNPQDTSSLRSEAADAASEPELFDSDVVDEDPRARLFRIGKTALVSFGVAEKRTGALIGQWLKSRPDPVGLLAAIQFARDQNVSEPVAYVSAIVHGGKRNGSTHRQSLSDIATELAGEIRERERAAGIVRPDDTLGSC